MPYSPRSAWLLKQLMVLAEARGAEVSSEGYELYASALGKFPDGDIQAVIFKVAQTKPGEFEKPWPRLGDLIEPLENMSRRRREQDAQKAEKAEEIRMFWEMVPIWVDRTGRTEAEILERWPSMKGTKPR